MIGLAAPRVVGTVLPMTLVMMSIPSEAVRQTLAEGMQTNDHDVHPSEDTGADAEPAPTPLASIEGEQSLAQALSERLAAVLEQLQMSYPNTEPRQLLEEATIILGEGPSGLLEQASEEALKQNTSVDE